MSFHRVLRGLSFASALLGLLVFAALAQAQPPAPRATSAPPAARGPRALAAPASADPSNVLRAPYRRLAPGVEITIRPDRQEHDTFAKHDIVEILQGIPGLEWSPKMTPDTRTLRQMATDTVFRRTVWGLEITFKPVRMTWVDVPQPSGRMQRKLIWYLLYHVKNPGQHLQPTLQRDGTYVAKPVDQAVRFIPTFALESHEYRKSYLDRIIPVAQAAIQQKEDPNRRLLNSVEITQRPIEVSTSAVDRSVWGVATWEDLDPRIDYFSIAIEGLTNAYQWVDEPGAFKAGDPPGSGRTLLEKTLVLNFWRPGDEYTESQRQIRYGIPGQVDYRWEYR